MKRIILQFALLPLLVLSLPACRPAPDQETREEALLSMGTWNLENFSLRSTGLTQEENDSKRDRIVAMAVHKLSCPDILAVQEVMDDSGIDDDGTTEADQNFAALTEALSHGSGLPYRSLSLAPKDGQDGGKPGANIRTGFLYNSARVQAKSIEVWEDEAFRSCRKPLVGQFRFNGRDLLIINVHLSSRIGGAKSQKARQAQADYLQGRIETALKEEPDRLILLTGDLNDTPRSGPLETLTTGRYALAGLVESPTYEYGESLFQLDHMLASPALAELTVEAGSIGYYSPRPFPSDHLPLLSRFSLPSGPIPSDRTDF